MLRSQKNPLILQNHTGSLDRGQNLVDPLILKRSEEGVN